MCGFRVVMLPPRKITIQPTAFLEGPSDVPRRVRPRAQQATGWLQPRVGGREAAGTHLELNKAVQRGDGVGPVPSGSLGAGRWRACALGLGEWVWPDGGPPLGCWGVSTPSSAIPATFRPSWRVQAQPPPLSHPFENKLWDPGSRGIPGPPPWWRGPLRPPCRWCGPPSAAQSTVQARPPTPPQTWCLTGAWRFPAPSGQFPE